MAEKPPPKKARKVALNPTKNTQKFVCSKSFSYAWNELLSTRWCAFLLETLLKLHPSSL
jgi:hypothetical protein